MTTKKKTGTKAEAKVEAKTAADMSGAELVEYIDGAEAKMDVLREQLAEYENNLDSFKRELGRRYGLASAPIQHRRSSSGGRSSGQREAIIEYVKAEPKRADDIAAHLGKNVAAVRQTLMIMAKDGKIKSYKQDNGQYREPGKGERGGFYGL